MNSISYSLRKPEKPNPSILVLHPVGILVIRILQVGDTVIFGENEGTLGPSLI